MLAFIHLPISLFILASLRGALCTLVHVYVYANIMQVASLTYSYCMHVWFRAFVNLHELGCVSYSQRVCFYSHFQVLCDEVFIYITIRCLYSSFYASLCHCFMFTCLQLIVYFHYTEPIHYIDNTHIYIQYLEDIYSYVYQPLVYVRLMDFQKLHFDRLIYSVLLQIRSCNTITFYSSFTRFHLRLLTYGKNLCLNFNSYHFEHFLFVRIILFIEVLSLILLLILRYINTQSNYCCSMPICVFGICILLVCILQYY